MMSYMILYMISYCEQDCVVVLAPFPNNPNPVQSFNIKSDFDLKGTVWCGMHALNSFSTVPCVPQAPGCSVTLTRRCPRCTSANLSPLS